MSEEDSSSVGSQIIISSPSEEVEPIDEERRERSHIREAASIQSVRVPSPTLLSPSQGVDEIDIMQEIEDAIARSRQGSLTDSANTVNSPTSPVLAEDSRFADDNRDESVRDRDYSVSAGHSRSTSIDRFLATNVEPTRNGITEEDRSSDQRFPTPPPSSPSSSMYRQRRSTLMAREPSVRSPLSPKSNSAFNLQICAPNRKLPAAMNCSDVIALKTPGERAIAYARKVNLLAKEDSGLSTWIEYTQRQNHPPRGKIASSLHTFF